MMGVFIFRQQATEPLPAGDITVRMPSRPTPAAGHGRQVTLYINDRKVGGGRIDHTVPVRFSGYAGLDIGRDNGGVVDFRYESRKPFRFNGTVRKVVIDIKPHGDSDEAELHEVASRTATGQALAQWSRGHS